MFLADRFDELRDGLARQLFRLRAFTPALVDARLQQQRLPRQARIGLFALQAAGEL